MMKYLASLIILLCSLSTAQAGVVIIGHPSGPDTITVKQVRDIYLNRNMILPDGVRAMPFELPEHNLIRRTFHRDVTERTSAQLRTFWAEQIFTGKGNPPQRVGTPEAMKTAVSSTLGSIGYLDESQVDDSVKVLLRLADDRWKEEDWGR